MRKLASIQRILKLESIPDADAILKATVLGWQLVVKKGEFNTGDLCIYCEIDSVFPDKPEFGFLRAKSNRLRTVRLRGQISQGICFPLTLLPEGTAIAEDMDVTELLQITKYDPPLPASLSGTAKGLFPSFIPKTDETRVQILQPLLHKYAGTPCYISEKLDGSSATFYMKDGMFGVCSRNLELTEDDNNTIWKLARQYQIEEKLRTINMNIALQGEVIGEGIQGNKYKLKGQDIYLFNAFDIDAYRYLSFEDFIKLSESLGLKTAPVLDINYSLQSDIETLVNLSKGKSVLYDVLREGIVIRPLHELSDRIGRVSFKAISPEFLLRYE